MQQIFEVLFSNVQRYLDVLGRFGPGWHSMIEERYLESMGHHQDPNDLLVDDFEYLEAKGGRSKVMQEVRQKKKL
jgi:hypothetical protein